MYVPNGVLSVGDINEYIKLLLDGDDLLSGVFVRGEISNLKYHTAGHIYFTLKDQNGILKAVMFRSSAARLKFELKDGMNIIAAGRISLYSPSGQYQLYTESIQPDGVGALYVAFEQIKEKLEAEGLFEASRKNPIPLMPMTIGIVTSPTGAAIYDMINVISRRFPLAKIVLYPALVQGEGAPESLIKGLAYFNDTKSADVIIIGRGGGSIEDLWGFNSEKLAYAIAGSDIPIISAVGHETDYTICDFVADKRAPTPSAAAEIAVPDIFGIKQNISDSLRKMNNTLLNEVKRSRRIIDILSSSKVLVSKESLFDDYKMKIAFASDMLYSAVEKGTERRRGEFGILAAKLQAFSPLNTLARGYSITQNADGDIIRSVKMIAVGDKLKISFSDGEISSSVDNITQTQMQPNERK